jgi:hypothetical protein
MDTGANSRAAHWGALQAKAHLPEVQAIIRREIACGSIWVTATPAGGIRIIPVDGSTVEESEPAPCVVSKQGHSTRSEPALRIGRITS